VFGSYPQISQIQKHRIELFDVEPNE